MLLSIPCPSQPWLKQLYVMLTSSLKMLVTLVFFRNGCMIYKRNSQICVTWLHSPWLCLQHRRYKLKFPCTPYPSQQRRKRLYAKQTSSPIMLGTSLIAGIGKSHTMHTILSFFVFAFLRFALICTHWLDTPRLQPPSPRSSVQWCDASACCPDTMPVILGAWLDGGCCPQQS